MGSAGVRAVYVTGYHLIVHTHYTVYYSHHNPITPGRVMSQHMPLRTFRAETNLQNKDAGHTKPMWRPLGDVVDVFPL